jgi:hypothetical protein
MGLLFGQIERDLYKDLERGKPLNDLKKSYQIKYQINARQFNSIHLILKCVTVQLKVNKGTIGVVLSMNC